MNFKSLSSPEVSEGKSYLDKNGKPLKKLTVPNRSMSLQEILERFTRGEPLEVSRGEGTYHEGDTDLEKIAHADLVDREEYTERLRQTQKDYEKQERAKAKKRQQEIDRLAMAEAVAAAKLAQASPAPQGKPGTGV